MATKLLAEEQVREQLGGIAKGMLHKPSFRARLGLPVVRIGNRIFFKESDVAALIERCTEKPVAWPPKDAA